MFKESDRYCKGRSYLYATVMESNGAVCCEALKHDIGSVNWLLTPNTHSSYSLGDFVI